jgi:peptidyl-prolyl cis-trans isomerase D
MLGYLRSGNKRTKTIWWTLTILTVLSFLGGFIFLAGMDPTTRSQMSGEVGSVDGQGITQGEWLAALEEQRMAYRQRFGSEPQDQDLKVVERDAWRALVNVKMFAREARKAGLGASDSEVLLGMRTNPPAVLLAAQEFQTDGKFDPQKYLQALANPANNWAPYEDIVRGSVPVRKLQERLLSAIKLTQPELLQSFHDRYDRHAATLLLVPAADTGRSSGDEATLARVYEAYRTRMASGARTQLEVLAIPKTYGEDEVKAAMDMAKSLYDRAIRGEDFGQLARDYSEGPNAERGGVIDRWLSPNELGGMVAAAIQVKKPGELIEPLREGGRVTLFKIIDPATDTSRTKTPPPYPGAVKLAQILVKVRPSPESQRQQMRDMQAIASRARAVGLSKAATEKGQSTFKTGMFDQSNAPPQLFAVPEAAEWGLSAKQGEVSPVFEGGDAYVVAQVALQHAAGPPTREELGEQLRMVADAEHRVDMARPRADSVLAALKAGRTLEQAAAAVRLAATPTQTSRQQPDPRLAGSPELLGMLLAAPPGKLIGPVRASQGWWFARKNGVTASPDSLLNDQVKGQLTTEILSARQRRFFDGYIQSLRGRSQITDARSPAGAM